jgi:murein DD-endopeptidase MepM/ murein hydrolase activator NlpD
MAGGKWIVMVLPDDGSGVRQFRLSREMVRAALAGCLILLAVVISLAAQAVGRIHGPTRTLRLSQQNATLRSQLTQVRSKVGELGALLEGLSRNDEPFRLLAGLDPLDEGVRQAGIGGPDTVTAEHNPLWRVDPAAGERVHQVNVNLGAFLRRAHVLNTSWREAHDSLKFQYERLARTPSIQPTAGHISSAFSRWRFHPILNLTRAHEGIDITAPRGTPIVAAAKGRVRFVGRFGEYGLTVEIDHGFNTVTRYAHASQTLVRAGQPVARGDTIALVGSTGLAVGPHLHYEVLVGGRPVNPYHYLMLSGTIPD